jgi:hypothetical protein
LVFLFFYRSANGLCIFLRFFGLTCVQISVVLVELHLTFVLAQLFHNACLFGSLALLLRVSFDYFLAIPEINYLADNFNFSRSKLSLFVRIRQIRQFERFFKSKSSNWNRLATLMKRRLANESFFLKISELERINLDFILWNNMRNLQLNLNLIRVSIPPFAKKLLS